MFDRSNRLFNRPTRLRRIQERETQIFEGSFFDFEMVRQRASTEAGWFAGRVVESLKIRCLNRERRIISPRILGAPDQTPFKTTNDALEVAMRGHTRVSAAAIFRLPIAGQYT